jgi:asparagine synthase (glutamine-hydrolysing)
MSGIAAIYHGDGRPVQLQALEKMVQAMAHRGPAGMTRWVNGAIGLGHCLMHTTPESLREDQPARDPGGACRLIWDGRLDNREELLRTLNAEGIPCGRETDPELVLAAYGLWGRRCVERLLGEFAFVLWDQRTRSLFGARDRMGLKPFYYSSSGPTLLIASEAKSLFRALEKMPDPDDEMVLAVLLAECREQDHQRSLFSGIHRLPPGHCLWVENSQLHVERYWQIDPEKQTVYRQPEAYVEHFLALFTEAVRCRTRSAFPVGSFLSGGLDSSAITALAASQGPTVEAFTAFSEDPQSDERRYARQVCEAIGIRHWEFSGTTDDPLEGLDDLLWEVESPLVGTDRNGPALTALVRSRNCRIVLDGEGADQLLDEDGYLADLLLRSSPVRYLRETRNFARWRGEPFAELAQGTLVDALSPALKSLGKRILRAIPAWINPHLARGCDLKARMCTPRVPLALPFRCQTVAYEDTFSPYFVLKLEMTDRGAAHAGQESWLPFLDSRLIEFVLSIPWHQRCHQGERKWLLRQAMKGLLPEGVRQRRGKGDWTRGMDDSLVALCRLDPPEPLANRSGMMERFFDLRGARKLLQEYLGGKRGVRWEVWALVAFDHWLERFWKGGEAHVAETAISQETVRRTEVARVR